MSSKLPPMEFGREKPATMSRRFRQLLEQVCAEHGGKKKHGVRTLVGKLFGLSQPHAHQLLSDKNPKWADHRTIEKARKEFAPPLISWRFFNEESVEEPNYHDYVIESDADEASSDSSVIKAARVPYRDVLEAVRAIEPPATAVELSQFLEVLKRHPPDLQEREIRILFLEGVRNANERLRKVQAEELNAEKRLDLDELGGKVVPIKPPTKDDDD